MDFSEQEEIEPGLTRALSTGLSVNDVGTIRQFDSDGLLNRQGSAGEVAEVPNCQHFIVHFPWLACISDDQMSQTT